MRMPVPVSLALIDALHARWVAVWRGMASADFSRAFVHPDHGTQLTLDWLLQHYAWHSHHHLAHITDLRRREGW
jgi:hypothetical protein